MVTIERPDRTDVEFTVTIPVKDPDNAEHWAFMIEQLVGGNVEYEVKE